MKRVIAAMAGLIAPTCLLSACAGVDPLTLAQAMKVVNEGCERTIDLSLDKAQPGGGSLKVTRVCAPAAPSAEAPKP